MDNTPTAKMTGARLKRSVASFKSTCVRSVVTSIMITSAARADSRASQNEASFVPLGIATNL